MLMRQFTCRCPNMAVKEAEENDLMDDDDDGADEESTSNGVMKSKLPAESMSGKSQHKCSRKPTVSHILFTSRFFFYLQYAW